MKILFIHQNFPAQFKHLGPALAVRGHEVAAIAMRPELGENWKNIRIFQYQPVRSSTPNIHPWLLDLESKIIRAEIVYRLARQLQAQGYTPDVIIAHPGWGESLFIKDVWPQAQLGIYCEFYYQQHGADLNFDAEFPNPDPADGCRLKIKNMTNHMHFEFADAGISPTRWQASTFPQPFRRQISIIHDGIDSDALLPNPNIQVNFDDGLSLDKNSEVITYVARNLEPYRGYHIFMRALPEILKRRPQAHILLIGNNETSYGAPPANGKSWKDLLIEEVAPSIDPADWRRVRFLGSVAYRDLIGLLQLSTLHVYLTYPFVLSWSLLEAMSIGCTVLASDTQPLQEVIRHGQNGWLTDFFDVPALTDNICRLLDAPEQRRSMGENARRLVREQYDLNRICLPRQLAWVESLC